MSLLSTAADGILIFDVETTGLNPKKDQIVELSCQVGWGPDGRLQTWRMKPEVPLSPEAEQTHGITMEDLVGEPAFCDCAGEFLPLFREANAVVGYNVAFDIEFLHAECTRSALELDLWADTLVVDLYRLWHAYEQRRLVDAHIRFVGGEPDGQHSSAGDVKATAAILEGMLRHFELEDSTWDELSRCCFPELASWIGPSHHVQWNNGQAIIAFGKHKGTPLADVVANDPDYLLWIQQKDFPPHVQNLARGALSGIDADDFHTEIADHFGPPPEDQADL